MRTIGSKKRFALIAGTTAAVLLGGGIAVGYWTTTGAGSGSADVGTNAALTISGSTVSDLYPGGPARPIDLTVVNPTDGDLQITTLTATIATGVSGCNASDFVFTSNVNGQSVASGTSTLTAGGSISMTNTSANQNLCKNATLTLTYASV